MQSFMPLRGTPAWDKAMQIFERMADLMNQTYHKTVAREPAHFGMSHFIYMAGNHLIRPDNIEQTLAYIEVANRHGIPALKKLAKEVESGVALDKALEAYPIAQPPAREPETGRKFAENLNLGRERAKMPPVAYADKLDQGGEAGLRLPA